MTKRERDIKIRRIMRLIWSSLDSHLEWVDEKPKGKGEGDVKFQIKCVREYAEIIKLLSEIL